MHNIIRCYLFGVYVEGKVCFDRPMMALINCALLHHSIIISSVICDALFVVNTYEPKKLAIHTCTSHREIVKIIISVVYDGILPKYYILD